MSSDHFTSDVFKEKRRPKNPIKFNVALDSDQKQAKSLIFQNTITVLTGAAGSGKTLVACQAALDMLFNKEVEKIIVARPVVTAREDIGFLPGGLKDKLDPFIAPIYDNMYRLYNKEKIDKEFQEGRIEIIPFAFMRGRNFSNAFIILDEAQNITDNQMELAITRLCEGSKMCIVGDVSQIDLKQKKDSGLFFVSKDPLNYSIWNNREEFTESILSRSREACLGTIPLSLAITLFNFKN